MSSTYPRMILPILCGLGCLLFQGAQAQSICPDPDCFRGGSCDRDNDCYLKDTPKCKRTFSSCSLIDCDDGDATIQECSNGGGDTGAGNYARLNLCEDSPPLCNSHIVSDGGSGVDLDDNTYQYWDSSDPEMTGTPSPYVKCNLSSGGRLHFIHPHGATVWNIHRWIQIHWVRTECPPEERDTPLLASDVCPDLPSSLYQNADSTQLLPPFDPDPCVDNLHFIIKADRLFKSGATRQNFEILFYGDGFDAPTSYQLAWYDYLYIDQPDENTAVLTTWDGSEHHSKARLIDLNESARKQDDILLGCYDVKFTLEAVKGPAGYN